MHYGMNYILNNKIKVGESFLLTLSSRHTEDKLQKHNTLKI